MKKISIYILIVGLFAPQVIYAQGIVYLSNLGAGVPESSPVASDSWLAAEFVTGTNTSGYVLNSIELGMARVNGNPSGFTVMLYTKAITGNIPGSSLGTLNGSTDHRPSPFNAGVTYAYADDSNIFLSPGTDYFIVLTAATTLATGNNYSWVTFLHQSAYNQTGGWSSLNLIVLSNDGSSWPQAAGTAQEFAVTATPVPEPTSSLLLLLGSGAFIYVRRTFHR